MHSADHPLVILSPASYPFITKASHHSMRSPHNGFWQIFYDAKRTNERVADVIEWILLSTMTPAAMQFYLIRIKRMDKANKFCVLDRFDVWILINSWGNVVETIWLVKFSGLTISSRPVTINLSSVSLSVSTTVHSLRCTVAHVKSIKPTDLVNFVHFFDPYVIWSMAESWGTP